MPVVQGDIYGRAQFVVNHMSWLSEWPDTSMSVILLHTAFTIVVTHSIQLRDGRAVTVQHTAKRMACSSAIA